MRLVPVQPEDAWQWQPATEWHFASFCRCGKFTPDELWSDILHMRRQMWVVEDDRVRAVCLTTISGKTCVMTHLAGDGRAEWAGFFGTIEAWARDIGCTHIEAVCRPGWERELKSFGLVKRHVVMEKAL